MAYYENLMVWKKSMELVGEVYRVTKLYPREELYALTSQSRRAAVSIPANIAEGCGRNYKKDSIQFFHVARGSIYELETLLRIAFLIEILPKEEIQKITPLLHECLKILNGFITYFEQGLLK